MIGTRVGRYRIVELLGAGGMGEVWRAHDERLQRDVALKLLPAEMVSDATARARLLREARAASALNHPNILTIYDVGEADGRVYIAMEFVPGRSLAQSIPPGGLPAETAARYAAQIADALAHAHAHRVIHRDIKPSNVLVTPAGNVKVLDFGIALRLVGEADATQTLAAATSPAALVGTPAAMAPELWRGRPADERSDLWALGALVHTMLAGAPPYAGATSHELSAAILTSEPAPLPARVPPALRAVVARCMARDPQARYGSAAEVRAALEAAQAAGVPAAASPRRRRAGALAMLAVAVVLALGILATALLPAVRARWRGATAHRITSLAVLPLDNFSHDPDQQYFADGMTEELITRLAQLGAVRVTSRTSVMRFRGTTLALPAVARQLGVDAIVEGSVERVGSRVRITAQLVRGATDEHLWASMYEREADDALALQDEVARAIVQEIQRGLTSKQQFAYHPARPVAPAVFQAYLRGRDLYQRFNTADARKALASFDQALAVDSGYAAAWSARAQALRLISAAPDTQVLVRAALQRALDLDPDLGEAHATRAQILFETEWKWAEAEREFQRALALNPSNVDAHHQYSHLLAALGRDRESREQAEQALQLDPLSPAMYGHMLWMDDMEGRFADAEVVARKVHELDPTYWSATDQLAHVELARHDWKAWKAALQQTRDAGGEVDSLSFLLADALQAGRRDEALRLVRVIASPADRVDHAFTELASWYALLGRRDEAFDALASAVETRDYDVLFLNVDPEFKDLRSDPRYAAIRRRMGLPL